MLVTDATAHDDLADRDLLEHALRLSASLLGLDDAGSDAGSDSGTDAGFASDFVDELLRVAWFNQYQLHVLVSLVECVQPSAETVQSVVDGARDLGLASGSAIGAAASLVGLVRDGDDEEIARFLAAALHHFSDGELRAASGSLATSLTLLVAETMNLPPRVVHLEMVDACVGDRRSVPEPDDATTVRPGQRPVRRAPRRTTYRRCTAGRSLTAR